jgi:hypothetical protein
MQKQKKRKKHSSEAWTEIQQKNYAFSGDPYILQFHKNNFIPFENFEEEELSSNSFNLNRKKKKSIKIQKKKKKS